MEFGIIRVLTAEEIVSRRDSLHRSDGAIRKIDECEHKFVLGCLSMSTQHCCLCLDEEWKSAGTQLNIQMEEFSHCPRCEGEPT